MASEKTVYASLHFAGTKFSIYVYADYSPDFFFGSASVDILYNGV